MMRIVEEVAWNYDPAVMGYVWDEEEKQDYQRHFSRGLRVCGAAAGP
ncbi:hypothetical protein ACFTAO_49500 [Paenibacillus rhizoplanae]